MIIRVSTAFTLLFQNIFNSIFFNFSCFFLSLNVSVVFNDSITHINSFLLFLFFLHFYTFRKIILIKRNNWFEFTPLTYCIHIWYFYPTKKQINIEPQPLLFSWCSPKLNLFLNQKQIPNTTPVRCCWWARITEEWVTTLF